MILLLNRLHDVWNDPYTILTEPNKQIENIDLIVPETGDSINNDYDHESTRMDIENNSDAMRPTKSEADIKYDVNAQIMYLSQASKPIR